MTGLYLAFSVLLLAANAFFVGAEFSAMSVRRAMLEPMAENSALARRVLRELRHLSMLLAGAQLGITLASLGLGAVAEPAVAHLLEEVLHLLHVPDALLHPIAFAIALTLVVFLHMVLGEMVPKNLSLASPERLSLLLVPALALFVKVTKPLILLLNGMANRGLKLLNVEPKDELDASHTPEELAEIIAESRTEGLLEAEKHERLTGALALENLTARDVMIPVAQLVTVTPSVTAEELEDLVAGTGYSRFPVASVERGGSSESAGSARQPSSARARSRLNPARALTVRTRGRTDGAGRNGASTSNQPAANGTAAQATGGNGTGASGTGASGTGADGSGRNGATAAFRPDTDSMELLGFIHAKDVLGLDAEARQQPLPLQRLRTMPALSPQQPLAEVLTEMQRIGSHLGQVQEDNRTVGLVTLEDVVEAFVGEVEDASHLDAEHDPQPGHEHEPMAEPVGGDSDEADGPATRNQG